MKHEYPLFRYFLTILTFICTGANLQAQDLSNFRREKPVGLSGSVELRGIGYQANGISNRRPPLTYFLNGSPTLSIYGIQIPFQFMLTKDQRSFQQPFNQFGLSPRYKWIIVHGGYRNVNFSPFTLAGHTMLGGGIELNPGKLRVGLMYGRLNRATIIDTLSQSLSPYSFDRKGLAVKLGFGTDRNHFDLHFLNAGDDSTSRPINIPLPQGNKVFAASNTVLGYGTKFSFFKHFHLESEGAISLYTRDVNSPIQFSDDEIPDPKLRRLKNILKVNGSSEWFMALQAGIGYSAKNYGLKLNYKRVDPEFKSMGAYYFSNDIENLTVHPHFSLPNGKLRFRGSVGVERDNVNLQKQSTSRRFIGSAMLNAELNTQMGIDVNYSNYSNNQRPGTLAYADSLKIVQTTQTLSFSPRYHIMGTDRIHVFLASANFNSMKDYNSYFGEGANSRDVRTGQYLLNYSISFPQKMISLFSSISHTKMKADAIQTTYNGMTIGGNFSPAGQKLRTNINAGLIQGKTQNGKNMIFNGAASANYQVSRMHSIRFSLFYTKNNPGSVITGTHSLFTETRGELGYQFNLGL